MSDAIERNDLEEVEEVKEVSKQRKKRTMTEEQKEKMKVNLAKGREKLKNKIDAKIKKQEIDAGVPQITLEPSQNLEDRRLELALQALKLVRSRSFTPEEKEQSQPIKPVKQRLVNKTNDYDVDEDVEEIIVKKKKPKKTIVVMEDSESEVETKPKRTYNKKQKQSQPQQQQSQQPQPIQPQNIIFY